MVLEKLVRSCPDVERIYVMIRKKKGVTLEERLQKEIFECGIFEECFFRSQECKRIAYSKIVPVGGDVGEEGLGFTPETKAMLGAEVQVILSVAANTMFTEKLTNILVCNYKGPM